jgi:hypothetical protein
VVIPPTAGAAAVEKPPEGWKGFVAIAGAAVIAAPAVAGTAEPPPCAVAMAGDAVIGSVPP